MMYNKNSNDPIKTFSQGTNNTSFNINKTQEPYSIKTQDRKDVPSNVNIVKDDIKQLFNAFLKAAVCEKGNVNINGGIHIRIDKVVITEHK